jgi:transposase
MMTNATPRTAAITVYAAIELSKKSWILSIARPDRPQPSIYRITGGNLGELVRRLRTAGKDGERLLVCYEAGYDGFWLARSMAAVGIDCRVLDPASLQVNRRARRVKTDRIDVLALVRALMAIDRGDRHVCAIVRVPTVEEEDARRSHRERQRLIRERTGHINRIKGLLFAQGIRGIEPKRRLSRIDFASLTTAEGAPLPERLLHELQREYTRLDLVEQQIRAVEKERDMADAQDSSVEQKRQMLCKLQGIGEASAAILAREVFARSFPNRRRLSSYLGLTPSAYDSGSITRCQGISKAGNGWARRVLIEIAWLWRKHQSDSALAHWYAEKTVGQSPRIRRIMLVALARKLAVALWRYVETGLIPSGAIMSKPDKTNPAAA